MVVMKGKAEEADNFVGFQREGGKGGSITLQQDLFSLFIWLNDAALGAISHNVSVCIENQIFDPQMETHTMLALIAQSQIVTQYSADPPYHISSRRNHARRSHMLSMHPP